MNRILVIYIYIYIYTLFSHRHAVNITTYSVTVPHVVYPCKPESRIKSESESESESFLSGGPANSSKEIPHLT